MKDFIITTTVALLDILNYDYPIEELNSKLSNKCSTNSGGRCMNKTNNQRALNTRNKIKEVLLRKLGEKDINQISV
jgi:hypothetical protein